MSVAGRNTTSTRVDFVLSGVENDGPFRWKWKNSRFFLLRSDADIIKMHFDIMKPPTDCFRLVSWQLTEDVLRSFGQALEDSVQRGDLRLDLSSDDGAGITITPTSTATGARAGDGGGISTGPNRRSLPQR